MIIKHWALFVFMFFNHTVCVEIIGRRLWSVGSVRDGIAL